MTKRVFVIWKNPLFCSTLKLLLNSSIDIAWAGDIPDYSLAGAQIKNDSPDIVIIEEEDGERTSEQSLALLSNQIEDLSVIGLNLSNNVVNLYQHKQRQIIQANDLIRIIVS